MKVKRIPAGIYAANCYIVMDEDTKETAVIDPGGDADDIKKVIEEMGCKVKYILLTHGHMDHTGGVDELAKTYNVPLALSEKDEKMTFQDKRLFGGLNKKAEINTTEVRVFMLGTHEIKVIETPGHTPGGVCFLIEDMLFTGDTLFAGSIGRTDLAGGDFDTLISCIKVKLMSLKDDTIVFPGHGPESTIKREKQHNPFL
ncbi:MAG: MBL fold metallo-hydrolase [Solirubrobacterales bacterium]